jgi:hypothetical protein
MSYSHSSFVLICILIVQGALSASQQIKGESKCSDGWYITGYLPMTLLLIINVYMRSSGKSLWRMRQVSPETAASSGKVYARDGNWDVR